ncbi:MAG TPA: TIM barrel protein [Bryobacteraceae bacterium]|nr:TIM barrel protein [Bryobacteraceae bacterium]
MQSRRDFAKTILAAVPTSMALAARINSTVDGVRLGASTYSFRDFPRAADGTQLDATIQALKDCSVGVIELFAPTIEPGVNHPAGGPRPAGGRMNSPEALKARADLRDWRLSTPMTYFHGVRKKFDDAGIDVYCYTMNYREDFTDEEIGKTFEQTKALGSKIIATSTQGTMAKRLLPFAEKHKIVVAFHGHANLTDPNEFATPESFAKATALSKYFKINLDLGHFTAANFDAVDFIRQNHQNITHLHIKDRKKDNGPNTPLGEGDTPIKQVLLLLKEKKYPIPALVEYEYRGTGTSIEEVKKCMDFMKQALV